MTPVQIVAALIIALCATLHIAPSVASGILTPFVRILLALQAHVRWSVNTSWQVLKLLVASCGLMISAWLAVYLFVITSDLPSLEPLINFRPKQIGYFTDGKGVVAMQMATAYRDPISYEELPPVIREAIIAAEDKRFRRHTGIDLFAWPRVAWMNWSGQKRQGGSTLTQQLGRTKLMAEETRREKMDALLEDSFITRSLAGRYGVRKTNTLIRKRNEIKLALYIERGLTDYFDIEEHHDNEWDLLVDGPRRRAQKKAKEHILSCYANQIYLGHGVYGFSYAARFYFGKSVYELRPHEAATLASFIPFPGPYSRIYEENHPDYITDMEQKTLRRDTVLHRMARNGFLTEDGLAMELAEPIVLLHHTGGSKTDAPAIINAAMREVKDMGVSHELIASGFAHPQLAFDLDIQRAVNEAVNVGMENFATRWPDADTPQVAVIILANNDAKILGLYGGHYEDDVHNYSMFNRATDAIRQPGSTFKTVDMMAAILAGHELTDTYPDIPMRISMGRGRRAHFPRNYNGVYTYTNMNLREIIARSQNLPTLWMARDIGIDHIIATAHMLGITTEIDPHWVAALGASGVTPLEMANAYRGMVTGIDATPYVVTRITDENGIVLAERDTSTQSLPIRPSQVQKMNELVRGTIRLPKGTGRSLASFFVPLGGKTGTSNDHKDGWFLSHTFGEDGIVCAAWVGYDEFEKPLPHARRPRATGGTVALPICRAFYERVYGEGTPLGHPPLFPTIVEASIEHYIYDAYYRKKEEQITVPIGLPPH